MQCVFGSQDIDVLSQTRKALSRIHFTTISKLALMIVKVERCECFVRVCVEKSTSCGLDS